MRSQEALLLTRRSACTVVLRAVTRVSCERNQKGAARAWAGVRARRDAPVHVCALEGGRGSSGAHGSRSLRPSPPAPASIHRHTCAGCCAASPTSSWHHCARTCPHVPHRHLQLSARGVSLQPPAGELEVQQGQGPCAQPSPHPAMAGSQVTRSPGSSPLGQALPHVSAFSAGAEPRQSPAR